MLESGFYNMDCMDGMRQFPDRYFELAIVDPPYGLGFGKFNRTNRCTTGERIKANRYKNGEWDQNAPRDDYFAELQRVSENQIVWGGNYFNLGTCKEFVFWYKRNPVKNFSDGEFAWTSFQGVAKCFDYPYFGNINSEPDRIHPTQKPVALYKWLLSNYAKKGDKILDTHVGSASSLIACHQLGFQYWGFELDKDYYSEASKRLHKAQAQVSMMDMLPTEGEETNYGGQISFADVL